VNKFIYKPNLSLREIRAGISDAQIQRKRNLEISNMTLENQRKSFETQMKTTSQYIKYRIPNP